MNVNRDRYRAVPVTQIWWMTFDFMATACFTMPDLNSFYVQRLKLIASL
ncbi:hypothetical protein PN498_27635 [Oscillatoria sp. CS-180]|nr:hypothetical protein [Oscillatoria sp. CS-180]MDB9529790.1 hypothetical protein [Oscillatoria sp. CS-180]